MENIVNKQISNTKEISATKIASLVLFLKTFKLLQMGMTKELNSRI